MATVTLRQTKGSALTNTEVDANLTNINAETIDNSIIASTRPSLNLNFVGAGVLDPRITFTRASSATRINSSGFVETVGSGIPRFDYDPITLQPKGLLIEEQRTNLLTYSEQFNNGVWVKGNSTVTENSTVAPDGTMTADKLVENYLNAAHNISASANPVTGSSYTFSVYLKSAERSFVRVQSFNATGDAENCIFNLNTGEISSQSGTSESKISYVGNGWYRCSIVLINNTDTNSQLAIQTYLDGTSGIYTGDGTSGIYIWGAQLEAGSFPTSYIKTEASQVTRSADSASMTGTNFSSWYRQDEGTLFAESSRFSTAAFNTVVSISDGTNNERIRIIGWNDARDIFSVSDNSVLQADLSYASGTTLPTKMAGAYKENDFALSRNGAAAVADASGTIPVVNQMILGATLTAFILNGHIRRIAYYPRRLTNAELRALTV